VQTKNINKFSRQGPLVHTYSIVARDPKTGELGVAVQSHWFSVGTKVSWAKAGIGAIATQSFINTSFGSRGLALLAAGCSADDVVAQLIAEDEGRELRQLAVVDSRGHAAAYTGQKCVAEAGHYVGKNFSVQANLMLTDTVWPAMAQAFESTTGPLAERMMSALKAAQAAGGDIRGKQSAALLVVRGQSTGESWNDRLIDLRVDDHPQPVMELERLLRVYRAYEYMNDGEQKLEANQIDEALQAYQSAVELYPDNLETSFWYALTLATVGQLDKAIPLFSVIFARDENWRTVVPRMKAAGILRVDGESLAKIMAV
jgi:uncharacterized Ntn-hydrolase superfamily protein